MTWRNVLMAIFGAWFVVSAWALNPMGSNAYLWTAVILGGLVLIGAVWALIDHTRRSWVYWIQALFGLYLGLTPFFYGFESHAGALWVTMIAGALVIADGIWQAVGAPAATPEGHSHRAA